MLPASDSVISFIQKRRDLIVDQILARYLSPRLRHYYFRFLKTNGRHIGILLLVSILTFYRHSHVTMHRPTKFRRNWTIGNGFMTSCRLLTWRLYSVPNLFSVSSLVTSHISEGRKVFANQISMRHLNPRLRYYYIQFLETNGCHIKILVQTSILIFSSLSA